MKKRKKKILLILLIALAALVAVFFVYTSDYYRADKTATALLEQGNHIRVQGNLTVLSPDTPSETALVFYPGGKVEHIAYLPLLDQLRQQGITCILVKMPFNLAVFDINAADSIYGKFPEIKNWYIAGHSLGGAMASSYLSKNEDKADGLILLGAYIYGNVAPENALVIYGTEDIQLDLSKIDPSVQNVVVIQGANHAQFGNYGEQKGDGVASIPREEQQEFAAKAIVDFIDKHNANAK